MDDIYKTIRELVENNDKLTQTLALQQKTLARVVKLLENEHSIVEKLTHQVDQQASHMTVVLETLTEIAGEELTSSSRFRPFTEH